jgi:predicted nucleic acid-binding protein
MPVSFLCDTNGISELMRPQSQPTVRQWLEAQEGIRISVLTLEELIFGLQRKNLPKKRTWLDRFVAARCEVLAVDGRIALRAGEMRGNFAKTGQTRIQTDLLIAATAWAHDCILVTRNTRDFEGTHIPLFNPFPEASSFPP